MTAPSRTISPWTHRYGPWALITGASDGIGRAFAHSAARRGLNVVLVARRQPLLDDLARELHRQYGVEARVIAADLSDLAQVRRVLHETDALDMGLLVASAGYGSSGPFVSADLDAEQDMLAVNVEAVLAMSHYFARRLAAQGRGGIVLLGSLLGFQGVPNSAHYAATKAYIQTLAEGLHVELRAQGVDVVSAAPGPVASGFASRANLRPPLEGRPESVAEETLNALGHRATVRPGFVSKFIELCLTTLPRRLRTRIMALVMNGMTRHRHQTADVRQPAL